MPKTISLRFNTFVLLLVMSCAVAFAANDSISYIPDIHGVFRGRWELETADGYSHFQVRNARVSIDGRVAPIIAYKIHADFCDKGKIMLLDAFATVTPLPGLDILVGQYRMPFGIESFRGPGGYFFNNRSFIGKYVNNYRAVGVSLAYNFAGQPITVEGGVFNPTVMGDHTTWVKKYAYAGRVIYRPGDWTFATGFESLIPEATRINLASLTAGWGCGNFYAEAEYMARWYTHKAHKTTHAYNIFANYAIPLKKGLFEKWSFQARVDGMSDLASGTSGTLPNGDLPTTETTRNRLTIGSTLDYSYKRLRAAVRLNFEKYWYQDNFVPNRGNGDLLSAELIVKF